jgi:taurine dioxygenase
VKQASYSFSINPLSPHTGAEVTGLDMREPMDPAMRAGLDQAFTDHGVLVVRDQELGAAQFLRAMQNFGDIFPQHSPQFQVPECPEVHYVSNQDKTEDGKVYIPGEGYHTDHSNYAEPPKATALHAVKLPLTGGDTQFVNMYEAYDALSEDTKRKIDGLKARHVYQSRFSSRKLPKLPGQQSNIATNSVMHPLVRIHPRSGRKAIYINPIRIDEIVGLGEQEALSLLDELLQHSTQLKFQYRHKWRAGDIVIWDNRCLMHKANGDYPVGEVRYLYRVLIKDDPRIRGENR